MSHSIKNDPRNVFVIYNDSDCSSLNYNQLVMDINDVMDETDP